jgi:hypothetical protein
LHYCQDFSEKICAKGKFCLIKYLAQIWKCSAFQDETQSAGREFSRKAVAFNDKIWYIINQMRLNKQQIEHLAFHIVQRLLKENLLMVENREKIAADVQGIISAELEKEDLLDEKVKEILKEKLGEIRNSNIDYYEMFRMVKSKLAEQENIVL